MISIKVASLIAVAAFVAGSFVASPELRAYAAATIGSADIINESILSADIKNGEVKAADIATDAVGAAELQGVTKLLFGQCTLTDLEAQSKANPGVSLGIVCKIAGVDPDDFAIAQLQYNGGNSNGCFEPSLVEPRNGDVRVWLKNDCSVASNPNKATLAIIVYDK